VPTISLDDDENKVTYRYGVESLSDMIITMKSSPNVEHHVHSQILAQNSQYFKAVIEGDRENRVIELPASFAWRAAELQQALDVTYGVNVGALYSLASYRGNNICDAYWSVGDQVKDNKGEMLSIASFQDDGSMSFANKTAAAHWSALTIPISHKLTTSSKLNLALLFELFLYFECTHLVDVIQQIWYGWLIELINLSHTYHMNKLHDECIDKLFTIKAYMKDDEKAVKSMNPESMLKFTMRCCKG
jgi:hypothetical protein